MIPGFEDQTDKLSNYELEKVLPLVISGLRTKLGVKNAITNEKINKALKEYGPNGVKTSPPRIRKIINYIRNKGLLPGLISSSRGYWISQDPKEVHDWINSLKGRELAIQNIRKHAEDYLMTIKRTSC